RTPRSGVEGQQFSELTHLISSVSLSPSSDRWSWTLNGTGDFSMKSVREWIDSQVLPSSSPSSSWSKFISIKVVGGTFPSPSYQIITPGHCG
nr:RNA-directed DNA polymerase, eukaryota [Tanacetum cinerariifolium]